MQPTQFGSVAGADFEADMLFIEMDPGYSVAAGPVAVVDRVTYDEMVAALQRVCRSFPTDTDMQELRWEPSLINEACDAYDAARAALAKSGISQQ